MTVRQGILLSRHVFTFSSHFSSSHCPPCTLLTFLVLEMQQIKGLTHLALDKVVKFRSEICHQHFLTFGANLSSARRGLVCLADRPPITLCCLYHMLITAIFPPDTSYYVIFYFLLFFLLFFLFSSFCDYFSFLRGWCFKTLGNSRKINEIQVIDENLYTLIVQDEKYTISRR